MGQKSIILAIALIIFTVILAILFVVSRMRPDSPNQSSSEAAGQSESRNVVSVIDIVNEPMVYDEYSLEVDSEINSWVTNRAFLFGANSGGLGGRTRYLLAVANRPFQLPQDPTDAKVGLGEKARVTAKGRIEILNKEQLEATLGTDFDAPENALYSDILKKWNLGPVLIINGLEVNNSTR